MDLRRILSFQGQERKRTILSAFLLFTVTTALVILKTARDSLFLSDYPAQLLPYFMAISPVATALVATISLRLYETLSLERTVELSLTGFAAGTLLLWFGIKTEWRPATLLLYVWVEIFGMLASVQAWSLISRHLLKRQAKRDFGTIGAGGIVGGITGGLFAKWVSQSSSVSAMLPSATVFILLALFAGQTLSAQGSEDETPTLQAQQPKIHRRFVIIVLIMIASASFVTTFADFQFRVIAKHELATAESLGSFFGSFYATIGIITLLFQLMATPVLMNRLGISATLTFLPLGLGIGNVLILGGATLSSAVFLKGSERLFKDSIDRSSLEVLYMAIPEHEKARLKSLIDTIAVRACEGAAALLLILVFSVWGLPLAFLAFFSLLVLVVWIASTILVGREYSQALKGAIQQKDVDFSNVRASFFTTDFFHLLPELLQGCNKETILDLLQLLAGASQQRTLSHYLVPLLKHGDAEVRLKALQLLFTQREEFSAQVEELLVDPDRQVQVEAIHYLCFRPSDVPMERLEQLLSNPELSIQVAACACSLNQEMEATQRMASEKLETLLSAPGNPAPLEVRLEVAHILEYAQPSVFLEKLCLHLLSDPSLEVRRLTLRGIARSRSPGILPALIPMLQSSEIRLEAMAALSAYGEAALLRLKTLLEDAAELLERKKAVLKVVADIGGREATQILLVCALGSSLALRVGAIKGLSRIRKHQSLDPWRSDLENLLQQEIAAVQVERERSQFFSPQPNRLADSVFQQRLAWAIERLFRVLGMMYDPKSIHDAFRAFTTGDPRRADVALELLDTILGSEHRTRLLPLLEVKRRNEVASNQRQARRSVLFSYLGARDELAAAACIADLGTDELDSWRNEIEQIMKNFPEMPLVQDELNRRYSPMQTSDRLEKKFTVIQKMETLGKMDVFPGIGPEELLLLANASSEVQLKSGSHVFSEGETANEVFFLVSGSVELRRASGYSQVLGPGQSFGLLSVLSDQTRLFSATVLASGACLKIDKESLWEILDDHPAMCRGIFQVLSQQIRTLTDH